MTTSDATIPTDLRTTLTSAATGSAIAWSMAIRVSRGHSRPSTSARSGPSQARAIVTSPSYSGGWSRARWSRSTVARTTNIPAFHRYPPVVR